MPIDTLDSPDPTAPVFDRWRLYVVGYLVWLILFTVVEGAGRQACRMPTKAWIAAAVDTRDRTMRAWFRDRADQCLADTRWYAYGTRALVICVVIAPLGAVWVMRRRSNLIRAVSVAGTVALMVGSIVAVRWLYDWYA